MKKNSKN